MESGMSAKRRYFACRVDLSLLELARKLRKAEVRVHGRTLQAAEPPCSISAGISSAVDKGRFQFTARRNRVLDNFPSEYISSSNAVATVDGEVKTVDSNRFYANCAIEEEVAALPRKLSLPNRKGLSLWPFLSSIKASSDAEHARFLERNQRFYSNYDKSTVAATYIEPLSESDCEIIIDNAVDALLQTRDSEVSQQPQFGRIESCYSLAVSAAPLSMNTDIDVPPVPSTAESDNISTMLTQPAVVSKRYSAAVASPRRFTCGLCPYSTNNRSHVRRHHISVHSDARPYRCYVCGKEFARCENAKVHMISRHPDVPYNVDRLRNNMFFMPDNSLPSKPTNVDSAPPTTTQSSNVSAFQLQQDVSSSISPQWPANNPVDRELNRARLERPQVIPPWLGYPKIEPKIDNRLPMFGHGSTGNHLLQGIPHNLFQPGANAVLNVQSLLGAAVKQEPAGTTAAGYPLSDRQVCLYCQLVCQNAAELANHIVTNHSAYSPALPAAPSSNPGYVVLQTAAPVFLFPFGSEPVMPNKSQAGLGYHPILPKLPAQSDERMNQSEASEGQHSSSVAAATAHRSPESVTNAKTASVHSSPASAISQFTPEKVHESRSQSTTPASSEGKPERKRQFKTFYCNRCPDRAPFRYEKSFEKHLRQHRFEDRNRKSPKITSKVA